MKKIIFSLISILSISSLSASNPEIKLLAPEEDTVKTGNITVVGLTTPGTQDAMINGERVYVFSTGTFGAAVKLIPGRNEIVLEAGNNSNKSRLEKTIFYQQIEKTSTKPNEGNPVTIIFDQPIYVVTTDNTPLMYSNGDDRLGGSKMGFIGADIPLKVIGESGDLYYVRLASTRTAYVPKSHTRPTETQTRIVNTGSWTLKDIGDNDRVVVNLPMRLPYQYYTDINPSTITIDLFGATDNSNWITQRTDPLGIIDFVDFRQVSEDIYRIVLRLKEKYQWGFKIHYQGNNLLIDVKHSPKDYKLSNMTIGLDAGHGGEFPGAYSYTGLKEKDINLDIALRVRDLLQAKGAKVVMTRDDDTGPSMDERKHIWADGNIDLAVSIHNNWGGNALSDMGTTVLYKHLSNRTLAQSILHRLQETGVPVFGLVGNFNFSLNAPTEYPNALVEGLFMNQLAEEEKLADPAFRQLMAEKIVAGIEDYLESAH